LAQALVERAVMGRCSVLLAVVVGDEWALHAESRIKMIPKRAMQILRRSKVDLFAFLLFIRRTPPWMIKFQAA
jgi:hypothetical protein